MGSSTPLLASTVKRNLAIHYNRDEPVIFCVLELHDLMTATCQLSPSAGLLWILLDRLIFATSDRKGYGSQALPTRRANRCRLTVDSYGRTLHQLRGNRL